MALPLSYNVRNLGVRWRANLLAILGIALVVAVFVVLAAMAAGFRNALRSTGRSDNAIVVQKGATSELTSSIPRGDADRVLVDERVVRGRDGAPLASPEIVTVANLHRAADESLVNVTLRGVGPRVFDVRGGLRIASGRTFRPGLYEILAGEKAASLFGLRVGGQVEIQKHTWDVVGVFVSDGSGFESELWGDVDVLTQEFHREGGYQSLVLRLKDARSLPAFAKAIADDPGVQLEVKEERQFYDDQAGPTGRAILGLAVFVSVVMGIGAVFGAMNTMYAVVAARTREIGTLRALGFSRRAVLVAFVLESAFLASIGGALGCLLALPADGLTTATGGPNFAELAFAFRITLQAVASGLAFAVVMGVCGGLLPALRGARLSIVNALRGA
ncbi:MAG TPA: ABC transporter permease [Vicinamibacteria bacterium]|nr:ABC transporter permease [Vicinamibacteria bacterium]